MNQSEANKIIAILRKVYAEQKIDPDLDTVWAMVFADVPCEAVMAAAKQYLISGDDFFPKPSRLMKIIEATQYPPELGEDAWTEVMREVRRVGLNPLPVYGAGGVYPAAKPEFSSDVIAHAVRSIGWDTLCLTEKPDITRAQFLKTFAAYQQRAVQARQLGPTALNGGSDHELGAGDDADD